MFGLNVVDAISLILIGGALGFIGSLLYFHKKILTPEKIEKILDQFLSERETMVSNPLASLKDMTPEILSDLTDAGIKTLEDVAEPNNLGTIIAIVGRRPALIMHAEAKALVQAQQPPAVPTPAQPAVTP